MKQLFYYFLILIFVLTAGCKSQFEQVRTSNDPVKILAAADQLFQEEQWFKAQGLYELIIPYYRGKTEAENLFYNYAYTHYNMEEYILAAHFFNSYTKTFYNSPRKEEMAFMSAYANYQLSPNYKLDQTPTTKAIEEMQYFANTFPSSPRVEECNALIDEMRAKLEKKAYEQGKLYYDLKSYKSAITSFENMLKDFPETQRHEDVNLLMVKSNEQLTKNSIYEKMEERLGHTIDLCNNFSEKYPSSSHIRDIKDIKKYCQLELKRFQ